MKIDVHVQMNLRPAEVTQAVAKATERALRHTLVDIMRQTKQRPPTGSPVKTGTNQSSITMEQTGLTGMVYSTSGYGGYLETGTARMPARPYFKPALDANIGKFAQYVREEMGK